jgi:hypothetical protein
VNERIRELAKQTGYIWHASGEPQIYEFTPEKLEKFAELIVLECVSVVEGIEPGYKDYRDQIEDAFRRDCVAEIKHKFGVEE